MPHTISVVVTLLFQLVMTFHDKLHVSSFLARTRISLWSRLVAYWLGGHKGVQAKGGNLILFDSYLEDTLEKHLVSRQTTFSDSAIQHIINLTPANTSCYMFYFSFLRQNLLAAYTNGVDLSLVMSALRLICSRTQRLGCVSSQG